MVMLYMLLPGHVGYLSITIFVLIIRLDEYIEMSYFCLWLIRNALGYFIAKRVSRGIVWRHVNRFV